MFKFIKRLHINEKGASAIEYALIAALVGIATITAFTTLGTKIYAVIDEVAGRLDAALVGEGEND